MQFRTIQSIIGWLSVGFFILWVLELRRGASLMDSYWLMMLFISTLMIFAYVRYKRIMSENSNQPPPTTFKPKKSSKK